MLLLKLLHLFRSKMTIQEVYNRYHIMPILQEHMFRVAAVAGLIAQNSREELDNDAITTACLLHDIGNIIKFKLGFIPEAVELEGVTYWQEIQQDFINKYGKDEHIASEIISKELGLSQRIIELINSVGFSNAHIVDSSNDIEKMICCYSDQRVSPHGIRPLLERINEGKNRFITNKNIPEEEQKLIIEKGKIFTQGMLSIEAKIFKKNNLQPLDITDETTEEIKINLKNFKIT